MVAEIGRLLGGWRQATARAAPSGNETTHAYAGERLL